MKLKIILLLAVLSVSINIPAADDYETLQTLKEQKKELMLKMHRKRVELIKKDPALLDLQKKIMALHKELAIRIDNNEEMRKLVDKLRKIEREIKNLEGDSSE
jgi:hypothetical protein